MKTETLPPFAPILLPSLRAKMGDRWYYIATMTFEDIARSVKRVDQIHEKAELKTWIQRELRPERTQQIAEYLRTFPQRFFNAIVLGVYQGEPEWLDVSVSAVVKIEELELSERKASAFGVIHLSAERAFSPSTDSTALKASAPQSRAIRNWETRNRQSFLWLTK